jgi:hypothetical protein
VGFRGDGAADFAAFCFDARLHFIAIHAERAGDDEGFAGLRQVGEIGLGGVKLLKGAISCQ